MPDKYLHTRLAEPDSFRLILLQPSPHLTAPLQLTIVTATLNQYEDDIVDNYVALSYVWENQKDTRKIDVDRKQLEITASLESALHHIRDASRTMEIWADGICIDQTDNEDKNIQVRQMGSIYGLARSTIIFLGEATRECDFVLDALSSTLGGGARVSKMVANILHDVSTLYIQSKRRHTKSKSRMPMSKEIQALFEETLVHSRLGSARTGIVSRSMDTNRKTATSMEYLLSAAERSRN